MDVNASGQPAMNQARRFPAVTFFGLLTWSTMAPGAEPTNWKKHVIVEGGHCNTAVAIDVNQDGRMDVIASLGGKVKLFLAPTWDKPTILHDSKEKRGCIHSTVLDADGDGDLDWAGAVASSHPFWLENPGPGQDLRSPWIARTIDHEITGIHCLTTADIDNDGRDDLIINNFEPDQGLGDSIAWFSRPVNPGNAPNWNRHRFAAGDARGGSHYMGAGDIDGDGWKEIAVGTKGKPFDDGNWFAFWKNPGGAESRRSPWKKILLADRQLGATNILPVDVNGDGRIDWLASRGHGVGVLWFENPGWQMRTIDAELEYPHSLTVADFDRDGDMDAASCGYGSKRVMWYQNNGAGKFALHTIDNDQESYDLRCVDMDGDGDMDLLNAGRGSRNVVWYENLQ